jgi:hypothetical protein
MVDEPREELTEEELEQENGELLPDREQMSTVNGVDPITGIDPIGGFSTLPVEPDT